MKRFLCILFLVLSAFAFGTKTFTIKGNAAQVEATLREALNAAVAPLDDVRIVQPYESGYPVFKNPIVVECYGAPVRFTYLIGKNAKGESAWHGIKYEGPRLTAGITFRNAKGLYLDGLYWQVKNSATAFIAIDGTSSNSIEIKNCGSAALPGATDTIGILIGSNESNDINNVSIVNCRFGATVAGTTKEERIRGSVAGRNVGVAVTGANTKCIVTRSCSFVNLWRCVDQTGNPAWLWKQLGGDASLHENIVASYCGTLVNVGGSITVTIRGGRAEVCGAVLASGLPTGAGRGEGLVSIDGLVVAGPLPYWNKELGIARENGTLVVLNSSAKYVGNFTVYGWDLSLGPIPTVIAVRSSTTPGTNFIP